MVLPIAFSKDFSDEIYRKSYKLGSMIKSLNNNTLNWDSLPLKMKSFSEITFQSLNIAFSTSILFYDKEIPNSYPTEENQFLILLKNKIMIKC